LESVVTAPDTEEDYVEFTRRMLDDLAAGRRQSADHYAKLFPGAAEQIRAELPEHVPKSGSREIPDQGVGADTLAELSCLPKRIGRYEVTGEIPGGGMARLFLANHPDRAEKLVIKTAKPGLAAALAGCLDRLRREATILGRLEHDRICPMTDVIVECGRVFVVMPFIEGETLETRLGRASTRTKQGAPPSVAWRAIGAAVPAVPGETGGVPVPARPHDVPEDPKAAHDARIGLRAVLALMEEVARAIHAAHEKGVVHRDLKPANVMVRPDGHPVVLDFGLAVDLSDAAPRLTARGDVLGTPSYMAPEQVRSDVDAIDRRTDVYALGVILYELLTFRRAFKGPNVRTIHDLIRRGRLEEPRRVNPSIPGDLEAVCLKAMEVEQKRRYKTALDLAEDLRRVRTLEATVARPITRVRRLMRRMRFR
jgi:eukaryotic-like serine/threonine-protein kinase